MTGWKYVKPRPNAVTFSASTTYSSRFFIFGGLLPNGTITDTTYYYDPLKDVWVKCAPMPHPVYAAAACAVETFIYVLGGIDSTGLAVTNSYYYDVEKNDWHAGPTTPALYGHTACTHPETSSPYVFGGYLRTVLPSASPTSGAGVVWPVNRPLQGFQGMVSGSDTLTNAVYTFSQGSTSAVSLAGTMAAGMANFGTAVYKDRFVHMGGNGGSSYASAPQFWKLDNTKGFLTPGPVIKNYIGMSQMDNLALPLSGGTISSGALATTKTAYTYDMLLDTWGSIDPLLITSLGSSAGRVDPGLIGRPSSPVQVTNFGVCAFTDGIYTIGGDKLAVGSSFTLAPTSSISYYNITAAATTISYLPKALTNVKAAPYGNDILITGSDAGVSVFYRYDRVAKIFSILPTSTVPLFQGGGLVVLGTAAYFMPNNVTSQVWKYNITTQTWSQVGSTSPIVNSTDADACTDGTVLFFCSSGIMYKYDPVAVVWTTCSTSVTSVPLPSFRISYFGSYIVAINTTDQTIWTWTPPSTIGGTRVSMMRVESMITTGPVTRVSMLRAETMLTSAPTTRVSMLRVEALIQ